jgi:uncharacterized membrane protein YdbT with pleckstrin-like domain
MATPKARQSQPGAMLVDRPVTRRAAVYTLSLTAIFIRCALLFATYILQDEPLRFDGTWRWGLFSIFLFGLTIAQALNLAMLSSERYAVTAETIEITSGILRRDARKIPFSRILDITANASIDQRLFGLGSITVSIANGNRITLKDITDSQTKAETLWELVHKN